MRSARTTGLVLALAGLLASGCALGPVSDGGSGGGSGPQTGQQSGPALEKVSPQDAARLRRVIEPLVRAADKPPAQVKIGIMSDKSINAANAGGGEFYVTRGLLDRATDEQLLAIMAHEVAHNDLGHVAKAQAVNAGVGIGAAILEQVIPQAAIITPIAGTLITRAHSRSEELEADRHAVTLLKRVGSSKQALENTLAWLAQMSGGGEGGGWFATHPGTNDRIQALRQLPS
jgi:predicted Zn-dependent protease